MSRFTMRRRRALALREEQLRSSLGLPFSTDYLKYHYAKLYIILQSGLESSARSRGHGRALLELRVLCELRLQPHIL